MQASTSRIESYFCKLNGTPISTNQSMNRLAYTEDERRAHHTFSELAVSLGMTVRTDAVGNTIARLKGSDDTQPVVAIGSHLDTVRNGGQFDGTAGIVAGLEVVALFNEHRIQPHHPIELIAFASEESSRFGVATLGSKAMIGEFPIDKMSTLTDQDGVSLAEALRQCKLNPEVVEKACRSKTDIKSFFELHIEQGPELESLDVPVGIVNGIAAPTRLKLTFQGQANHTGTTSMMRRKDALVAASEMILFVEDAAKLEAINKTVATVGICEVTPASMNVIPGEVTLYVDIRSTSMVSKQRVHQQIRKKAYVIEQYRGVTCEIAVLSKEIPIVIERHIQERLQSACEEIDIHYENMPSGAGHDAMNMAKLWPTGMIFVPCKNGVSHDPTEYSTVEQIAAGTNVLITAIRREASR
ncbi:Zn-dependent hydrolase [Geomicrobium sp. JCM 19038]|uniref:Zn-dependent hydrolase n=1 Tax=Geomicrobium sp. JCM 19038 TaxID=1460635 RepID=UPI00045F3602|nr:Zn-dependent hydrolase [Geomicrobium sp. JCM 19038]GAK08452.1 N-carbamoyl-L-amino acid hydrolase [Geomicrobium sp. JCM 19038]